MGMYQSHADSICGALVCRYCRGSRNCTPSGTNGGPNTGRIREMGIWTERNEVSLLDAIARLPLSSLSAKICEKRERDVSSRGCNSMRAMREPGNSQDMNMKTTE